MCKVGKTNWEFSLFHYISIFDCILFVIFQFAFVFLMHEKYENQMEIRVKSTEYGATVFLFLLTNKQRGANASKCFGPVSGFSGLVSQVCGANCLTRLISNKCALIEA